MKYLFVIISLFFGLQSFALTPDEAAQIASQFSEPAGSSELARLKEIIRDAGFNEFASEMSDFGRVGNGNFLPPCRTSGYCRPYSSQVALTNDTKTMICLVTTTVSGRTNAKENRTTTHSVSCR